MCDYLTGKKRSPCSFIEVSDKFCYQTDDRKNTAGRMPEDVVVATPENLPALPPVLAGAFTPEIQSRVENFFHSVAAIFEAWVNRRNSDHTRRAYRGDVMAFVEFRGWAWPDDAAQLLRASILDVQAFKDHMARHGGAPKTINRRISSLSSFYKFLHGAAAGAAPANHGAQSRACAVHLARILRPGG